ncbi:hypothetical protein, partial [Burkholderia ubonensis]|uniref:hypothetical protein n=1 Tax=Burkholderia ubonensis TaxID=101571 RepID=UPI001E4FF30C
MIAIQHLTAGRREISFQCHHFRHSCILPFLDKARVCLHTEHACVATRTAAREARDAANTRRIRKERNAASGRSRRNPKF